MNLTDIFYDFSGDDNQAYLISLVNLVSRIVSQFGLGFIWIFGNISSILMCMVFIQPTYRNSPCAMFFLAASISQFFAYNFALFTRMLPLGYHVAIFNYNLWYCKLRFYLFYVFVALPRYYIILASIDRYFASSREALRRRWSSPKIAYRLIIGNALFWCIMYAQVIVFYEIASGTCTFRSGSYGVFFSIYIAIDSGILPLLLMIVFGLLTVRNIHQRKMRIGARERQVTRMGKKDLQLHRMLANQIALFLILNLPNPIYLLFISFTINIPKSTFQHAAEILVGNMTYALIYFGFLLTFTNFMISSDIFRQEFFHVFRVKILRRSAVGRLAGGELTARPLRPINTNA
ncbi:unnamed protein product [Adineta ricciae]|uniref:G-protein coupled receptors family 1 profile domain-containing protein n=1 Tax=Adineta ricciae TaxID=249248 RepID=A0A814X024_ADIRI|nr:unnamed protein product [Adineta ricciae]CAF1400218.1 unnamed protein product [Adineta ricciae]